MLFRRLGTVPPIVETPEEYAERLGLSVRLDRPFHELKHYLISEFERTYLSRCLEASAMNISMASRTSGLSRKHIRTLIAKYGLAQPADLADDADSAE